MRYYADKAVGYVIAACALIVFGVMTFDSRPELVFDHGTSYYRYHLIEPFELITVWRTRANKPAPSWNSTVNAPIMQPDGQLPHYPKSYFPVSGDWK